MALTNDDLLSISNLMDDKTITYRKSKPAEQTNPIEFHLISLTLLTCFS